MFSIIRQHQQIEALQARIQSLQAVVAARWNEGVNVGTALDEEMKAKEELRKLQSRYQYQVPRA